jgi:hypothetical protein
MGRKISYHWRRLELEDGELKLSWITISLA